MNDMGFVIDLPPKYIPWDVLQIVKDAVKSQDKQKLDDCAFHLRAKYDIDWDRKSLDLRTGQIICEWFNDRNKDRDFRE